MKKMKVEGWLKVPVDVTVYVGDDQDGMAAMGYAGDFVFDEFMGTFRPGDTAECENLDDETLMESIKIHSEYELDLYPGKEIA